MCGRVVAHADNQMSTRVAPVPLVELAAAAPLNPIEAVTIVREVVQRVTQHELPGVPSAHVIRLSPSGGVIIEGPIAAHGSAVRRAAQLLEALLPPFDARVRVPGALRLLVARALGTLDLAPYPSLESFADALSRFAAIDPGECLRHVVASRPEQPHTVVADEVAATHDATITVSDIRRARRATGVSLADISRRCQVPMQLLRELEWGYLANWPASHMGRRLLISYARAGGLDEELVVRTVSPLLAEWVRARGTLAIEDLAPLPVVVDVPVEPARPVTSTSLARIEPVLARRWDARRIVAMLTIPALLAIGAAPAVWQQHSAARREAQSHTTAAAARVVPAPIQKPEVPPAASQTGVMLAAAPPAPQPVRTTGSTVRQASYRAPQQVVTKNKRAAAAKSAKGPQVRRSVSRSKGPRKWGVWVLNKVGVRIVSTEQQ